MNWEKIIIRKKNLRMYVLIYIRKPRKKPWKIYNKKM